MSGGERIGRMGQAWLSLMRTSRAQVIQAAFGLPYPVTVEQDTCAQALALLELGLGEARVIAEPRYGMSQKKVDRDAALGRDTIHNAPTWRYADRDETGSTAIILPVGLYGEHECTMSLSDMTEEHFAECVVDLIAIPIDGRRPMSMTGHTNAVGTFAVDGSRLVIHANAMTWLKRHLAQAKEIASDTPGHLIERHHFPLPSPYLTSTLVIEPLAIDWRVTSARCAIPMSAAVIEVPDSHSLAQAIDMRMRLRERVRSMPIVRGPKQEKQKTA